MPDTYQAFKKQELSCFTSRVWLLFNRLTSKWHCRKHLLTNDQAVYGISNGEGHKEPHHNVTTCRVCFLAVMSFLTCGTFTCWWSLFLICFLHFHRILHTQDCIYFLEEVPMLLGPTWVLVLDIQHIPYSLQNGKVRWETDDY